MQICGTLLYLMVCLIASQAKSCGKSATEEAFGFELLIDKVDSHDVAVNRKLDTLLEHVKRLTHVEHPVTARAVDQRIVVANPRRNFTDRILRFRRCSDMPLTTPTAVYIIEPEPGKLLNLQCAQDYQGGGWTVVQYRRNKALNFDRSWQEYRDGFGDPRGEYWLGLELIRLITSSEPHELLLQIQKKNGRNIYARYDLFEIGSEQDNYRLTKLGNYTGTAGDGLRLGDNMMFSTRDRDNDNWVLRSCADLYGGGWWYNNCGDSTLNRELVIFLLNHRGLENTTLTTMMVRRKL